MPLALGDFAPDFRLRTVDNAYWVLGAPDRRRSVLLVFFRRESKACRVLLPFVERLHRRTRPQEAEVLGISLDGQRDSLEFAEDYTLTFPMLLDPPDYPTAQSYRVDQVPALFRLDADLRIADHSVGWSRSRFQSIAEAYLSSIGSRGDGVWEPGDIVPDSVDASPVVYGKAGGAIAGAHQ